MSVFLKSSAAVLAGLAIAVAYALPVPAQENARPNAASSTLQTHLFAGEGGNGLLVVVDAGRSALATYEVSGKTGYLTLKSVRQIGQDFLMDNFNSFGPKPEDIRQGFPK